ncbi:hypothetical protein AVEN_244442-1 [Araneus ventricosus]|uniref:Uncharacterized protein n=1 Tax=Araneus ventricosus TaxID=182803 RepID=A0A4Y2BSS8_ARAVE|nr:hypothetical protein AVEN_244442-1 [Araneus ventricosus]
MLIDVGRILHLVLLWCKHCLEQAQLGVDILFEHSSNSYTAHKKCCHLEATRGLFWTELIVLNRFQISRLRPELVDSPSNFHSTPTKETLTPTYDLACNRPAYTADIQWSRVSNPLVPKPRHYHYDTADSVKEQDITSMKDK